MKAEELLEWVGGIEAAEPISCFAVSAARKVGVLSFVPLELDPQLEEIVEIS